MTTTTTTMSSSSNNSTYEQYLVLAEKALQKSRASLDNGDLIELAYGSETGHIGGSELLEGILDGILDQIGEAVLRDLRGFPSAKDRLDRIDDAISRVVDWETAREQHQRSDIVSARDSLQANLLPEGVTLEEVIAHHDHEAGLAAKRVLEDRVAVVRDELRDLEDRHARQETLLRERLSSIQTIEQRLEASARVCAMI